jgi:NAD(P)-dependent dehydrogenase (short-subunit alcohol dehydrogenase family)
MSRFGALGRRPLAVAAGVAVGLAGWRIARDVLAENLAGQVALVTGGSRGLGLLLARELGRHGCRVVICARDSDELETAQRDLEGRGVEVLALTADVGDPDDVDRLISEVATRYGPVDILVNNASILQVGPLHQMAPRDFIEAHQANFWGMVHPTLVALPAMLVKGRGRIVNITSIGGRMSVPHLLPYGAAKFAAVGFSEGLRAELAGQGVSVTTVVPGLMRTGSYRGAIFKEPQQAGYAWFSLAASLPVISTDAERAARGIVSAVRLGDADFTIGLPAVLASRFHGLFPGLTADLLGVVNRILPKAPPVSPPSLEAPGIELERREHSDLLEKAREFGTSAAERLNQPD